MADNINITEGTGAKVVATDDVGGVQFQRVKLSLGIDGVFDGDVSESNPIPTKSEKSTTGTISSVTNTTASQVLLAANANRKGFIIHNDSTATVYLALSATSSTTLFTFKLTAQGSYIYNLPFKYVGVVSAIASAASGNLRITELT